VVTAEHSQLLQQEAGIPVRPKMHYSAIFELSDATTVNRDRSISRRQAQGFALVCPDGSPSSDHDVTDADLLFNSDAQVWGGHVEGA
jgi:hypothetical protein